MVLRCCAPAPRMNIVHRFQQCTVQTMFCAVYSVTLTRSDIAASTTCIRIHSEASWSSGMYYFVLLLSAAQALRVELGRCRLRMDPTLHAQPR
jgi:hypothetical protein